MGNISKSFISRHFTGDISVSHKAKNENAEILRYTVMAFGFLLPRGKTMSLAAFSYLIEEYYAGGTRINECLRVLRSS